VTDSGNRRVAYVSSAFPHLTETFVLREVDALEQRGWAITVFALKESTRSGDHEAATRWSQPVCRPGLLSRATLGANLHYLRRAPLLLMKRWLGALWWHRGSPTFLPAHDIFTCRAGLRQKLGRAGFFARIADFNRRFLLRLDPRLAEERPVLLRCGIDPERHLSGIPELVVHEHTGLLVPPSDPTALAQAIARLIQEPALGVRLGRQGRQLVLQEFNLRQSVNQLSGILQRMLDREDARLKTIPEPIPQERAA
jgi:hypothetical protein